MSPRRYNLPFFTFPKDLNGSIENALTPRTEAGKVVSRRSAMTSGYFMGTHALNEVTHKGRRQHVEIFATSASGHIHLPCNDYLLITI